jgi:hypothetical protein
LLEGRLRIPRTGIVVIVMGLLFIGLSSCQIANESKNIALIEAVRKGDLRLVQDLLDKGANLNVR